MFRTVMFRTTTVCKVMPACTEEKRNVSNVLMGNLKERDHLEDLSIAGWVILK
jgi:hypothetical protein